MKRRGWFSLSAGDLAESVEISDVDYPEGSVIHQKYALRVIEGIIRKHLPISSNGARICIGSVRVVEGGC